MNDTLEQFEKYHPTIHTTLVQPVSSCEDKVLFETVKQYEKRYSTCLETVCSFPENSVLAIKGSRIETPLRSLVIDSFKDVLTILAEDHDEQVRNPIELHRQYITEIATCHQPSSDTARLRYRHHFGNLVRIVFSEFFKHHVVDGSFIYLAPLRAAAFVTKVGLAGNARNADVLHVHTKRVYFDSDSVAVAIGRLDQEKLANKQTLVICEGGVVSGLSIVALMEVLAALEALPPKLVIVSIHAALYGIVNVMRCASRLNIQASILTAMTSFGIGRSLYAFYDFPPWKTGALVTGDIGDYLEPVNSHSLSSAGIDVHSRSVL